MITDSLSLDPSKKQTTQTQNNDMTGRCLGLKVTVNELLCSVLPKTKNDKQALENPNLIPNIFEKNKIKKINEIKICLFKPNQKNLHIVLTSKKLITN